VQVEGVALAFVGEYQVTEAVHSMDGEHGYLTTFSTAPPPARTSAVPAVAPGIVERVDDPDGRGRVTVSFPTMRSVGSEWFRVLLPAVGHRSGLVALPRKGDEVLVLFPSGDPAAGVVLGGLYSGDDPPEFGVVDGDVRRYTWRTREGQQIELDEANDRIRLAIPNGSAVTIGRKQLTIHSATDLEISAPGKTIAIKAKAVDFQRTES
jgi:phage baseplate assembly protein V